MTRKEKKQCHVCGGDSGGKYHCEMCRKAHNKRNQHRRKARKDAGLCTECGRKPRSGRILCDDCNTKNCSGKKYREKIRGVSGICAICDSLKVPNRRLCEDCAKEAHTYRAERSLQLIAFGLCTSCGKKPYLLTFKDANKITRLCQVCHLKQTSAGRFGSTKYWKSLLSILEQQNWTCPYSGDKIVLGVNDSMDHILPISKHPERKFDMDNIQWVTRAVNTMKFDLLEHEFLAEIVKVIKNLGDDLYLKAVP